MNSLSLWERVGVRAGVKAGVRAGGRAVCSLQDNILQISTNPNYLPGHSIHPFQHIRIREADYLTTLPFQPFSSHGIIIFSGCMTISIDLDHQFLLNAEKINHKISDWVLPAKLISLKIAVA